MDDPSLAPSDPDAAWLTRGVRFVGRSIALALLVAVVRVPLAGLVPDPGPLAILLAGMLAMASALWINHRGRSRLAAQIMALTLPALAAGLAISTGRGFRDPAVLILPASLVLCGVLLDRRTLAVTTAVTLAAAVRRPRWPRRTAGSPRRPRRATSAAT